MAELWPSDLPQKLNVQGHQYNFGDPTIRSAPSVGPSKVRPRSSAVSQPLSGQMYLTSDQLDTLRDFYKITVRGADVFLFPDPEGTDGMSPTPTLNCRFVAAPTIVAVPTQDGISGDPPASRWSVTLPMEIVP